MKIYAMCISTCLGNWKHRAGNAATALSKMLNDKVRMSLPIVRITGFNDAVNALGGPETMTVGVLVKFCGEADGMIMFLLDMEDPKEL